ncbi:LysR family transcriptional regulator [Buttiauxella agrestis]|uniref:LysR family transcriptional regulator n=1 Tax=Buttiauxella agrestis TaxID=82977 RepID=UPI001560BD03|nr:LysR family transcriptional regulator [Buttiauxella agrestis]BCG09245.1 LysR family transcriptional regulator [Buttiauxella agrestis]
MELRHIRYFLAVADAKSFTYAAEKLGIGQPPLSIQIRDLENEVGTKLFHRIARGIELTAAGIAFYNAVKVLPGLVEEAKLSALLASRGELGVLQVGFTSSSAFNSVVTRSIKKFNNDYKNVSLQLDEAHTDNLIKAVENGTIDVAFVRTDHLYSDSLKLQLLLQEPLTIVLPEHHAYIAQSHITLNQLANEEMILCPRNYSVQLHDTIYALFERAGCTPTVKQTAPQLSSIINLVSAGIGVSIVPSSMKTMSHSSSGVAFYDIAEEGAYIPLSVVSRTHDSSPIVKNFINNVLATHAEMLSGQ